MSTWDDSLRISDSEREAAVSALGEHYAAGRLTREEYDDRAAHAFEAKTASALRPLFADLPGPRPGRSTQADGGSRSGRPSFTRPPGPWAAEERPRRRRLPVMPVLLVLVGAAILFGAPWLVFVGLGVLWFSRGFRGCGPARRDARWRSTGLQHR